MLSSLNKLSESDLAAGRLTLWRDENLEQFCLDLERKTPKEDEKIVVLLSFLELFVSDFVGGKIDGIKEEKR